MEDLIKVAPNGQWTLEKARSKEEERQMIEQFLAQAKAKAAGSTPATPTPRPAPSGPNYPAGMRPAQISTQNHVGERVPTKEEVTAQRAVIDRNNSVKPRKDAETEQRERDVARERIRQMSVANHGSSEVQRLSNLQAKDNERAQQGAARKKAWEATVGFLANNGERGYQGLKSHLDQQARMKQAQETGVMPETERLPPMEGYTDEKGNRKTRIRRGTFHNQGAVTRGKIVTKRFQYEDKETGEPRFRAVPMVEQHHWSWQHDPNDKENGGQWKHIKTTYGSASGS